VADARPARYARARDPERRGQGDAVQEIHCACGAELPSQAAREASFGFDLAYPDTPAFRGEIGVPVYKCGACGKEQARSAKELAGAAPAVVAALNDAAGNPHSG
jgi:hypothetical protein